MIDSSIKNIEIINKNIKKLKGNIAIERITNFFAIVNMTIMGSNLYTYRDSIDISSKFIGMLAIGMCYVIFCTDNEKIKCNKFKIDELKFEIEKLELADKSR